MAHRKKFIAVLAIGVIALVLRFGFNLGLAAQIIVTVTGALLALSMFIEMIKTLRSGKYGVDLLAIMSIAATLIVGEYWASLMISSHANWWRLTWKTTLLTKPVLI
jgi:cation transport ATPase